MATVREVKPGRWELRVYLGKDPLTGKPRQPSKTVDATGKRDATAQANEWEVALRGGRDTADKRSFGDIIDQYIALNEHRWSPGTLKEHTSINRRYLRELRPVEARKITAHTLDVFYAGLVDRGGQCQRRPCRPACAEHGPRCEKARCERPACHTHHGRCTDWVPCDDQPCPHGGPLAVSTVRRAHRMITAALEMAVRYRWLPRNEAAFANPGEIDEDEVTPPEPAEIVTLLAEAERDDFRLAAFLLVAIDTGARRGANCALRRHNIDFATGTARFPNVLVIGGKGVGVVERRASRKKRSGKLVALNPYTLAALSGVIEQMEHRARAAEAVLPHDCYLFSDDVMGQVPWHPDTATRRVRRLLDRLGMAGLNLHAMRHAMATLLLGAGIAPQVVARRGGWSNVATMLNRYAHSNPTADRAAADAIGALLAHDRLPR